MNSEDTLGVSFADGHDYSSDFHRHGVELLNLIFDTHGSSPLRKFFPCGLQVMQVSEFNGNWPCDLCLRHSAHVCRFDTPAAAICCV
jgi:hypothetical protein